jgi:hypothetical protein
MNKNEILTALGLAKMELRAMYLRLGIKNSNVLDVIEKCAENVSKSQIESISIGSAAQFECTYPNCLCTARCLEFFKKSTNIT